MKKILMVFIVLLILIIPNIRAYALEDSFYEGEYISGEYIKKFRGSSGKYEQLRFFRRKSDNQAVYCIQLWETLSSNKTILGYDYDQYNYANIDYSVWERIMLISYYGYGYGNHTDSKWYAITQFMIWQETSPDSNIYFTDTLNGRKITKYQDEMNEINRLIQNHANIPSFYNQTYQMKYKESIKIQDTNNVLDRFDIISDVGLQVSKNGNNLTVFNDSIGESQILFANTGDRFQTSPIVYIDNNGQNLMAPGKYYPIYMVVNVEIPYTNVTINKVDLETQSNIPQGDAKLEGTKIQLLDIDNQLVNEKYIDRNGTLTFENVGYGTYYIKEIEAGTGYLLNKEIKTLEVGNNTQPITFGNQVIKNEVILKKYLKNPLTGDIQKEANAVFSIFNSRDEKVVTLTTDENGIARTILPYGTYHVKQEQGMKNHSYVEDFVIEVKEHNKIQTFELYNEELVANIKLINVDHDSNLPILEGNATFRIKDLDTNEYVKDNKNNILILTTNDFGSTEYLTLSSGKYEIEQITSVDGYEINQDVSIFEISDDVEFKLDENEKKYLEIIVPNDKQKSRIEIEKYVEYYLNDKLIKREKENSVIVPIYAKEDIYSKDGVKIYEKDELVDNAILKEEKIITKPLVFGTYYLKNSNDDRIIEIMLNKLENQKVKLVDKVYNYEEIILDNEKDKDEENNSLQEENILNEVKPEIEESIPNEVKPEIEENISNEVKPEIEENISNEVKPEIVKDVILVPNTFTTGSVFSNIKYSLILVGMILIKKGKKYEKN